MRIASWQRGILAGFAQQRNAGLDRRYNSISSMVPNKPRGVVDQLPGVRTRPDGQTAD